MPAAPAHESFQRVLRASRDRLLGQLAARLRAHPAAARHGVAGYLKPVETGRDRTALRRDLAAVEASGDPGMVESVLAQIIAERGMQGLTELEMRARPVRPDQEQDQEPAGQEPVLGG